VDTYTTPSLFDDAQSVSATPVQNAPRGRRIDVSGVRTKKTGKATGEREGPLLPSTETYRAHHQNTPIEQGSEETAQPATPIQPMTGNAPVALPGWQEDPQHEKVLPRSVRREQGTLQSSEAQSFQLFLATQHKALPFPSVLSEDDEQIRTVGIDQYEYILFFSTELRAYVIHCYDTYNTRLKMWLEFGPFTEVQGNTFIDERVKRAESMKRA
jgi:hypothetical protein